MRDQNQSTIAAVKKTARIILKAYLLPRNWYFQVLTRSVTYQMLLSFSQLLRLKIFDMIHNNTYQVLHLRQCCLTYRLHSHQAIIKDGPCRTLVTCYVRFTLELLHTKVRIGRLVCLGSGGILDAFQYWCTKFSHSVSTQQIPIVQQ